MINKINKVIKAAFNERNTHMTQQQEPVTRSPGGLQTKTGQDTRQSTNRPTKSKGTGEGDRRPGEGGKSKK
jgi:hypothetical protein